MTMNCLYERKAKLVTEIKKLEKDAFNPNVRPRLKELWARYDELVNAIIALEHEI